MDDCISREAKDLVQKMIGDVFQSSLTEWYGLTGMRIIATRPSAVPLISIQERLLDQVFELDDHTLMHLEFQSTREPNLYRFFEYAATLTVHYRQPVRTVVVYLNKVRNAPKRLELGSIDFRITNIFIADKNGQVVWDRLRKLPPDAWSERDVMDLAFFPFMDDPRSQDARALASTQLASTVAGETGRLASALIIGLTASLVDPKVLKSMKEVIRMNDLITELEREAIERGWKKGLAQGHAEGRAEGLEEGEAKGRVQGRFEILLEVMTARFGELPANVTTRLQSLTDPELSIVARNLASVESREALFQLLDDVN